MELNILERLMLVSILPQQGDIVSLKLVQDLKMSLAFTEEEIVEYKIVNDDNQVTWDPEAEYVKDVQIGPKAMSLIVSELEQRNEDKTLSVDFISLYDKIMDTTE